MDAGFYPPGTGSARMLAHYAGVFPVSEINYTWYQMPKAPAMDRMRRRAPEGFRFAAKLTRTLTHEVDANEVASPGRLATGRASRRWCSRTNSWPCWFSCRLFSGAPPRTAATWPGSWTPLPACP